MTIISCVYLLLIKMLLDKKLMMFFILKYIIYNILLICVHKRKSYLKKLKWVILWKTYKGSVRSFGLVINPRDFLLHNSLFSLLLTQILIILIRRATLRHSTDHRRTICVISRWRFAFLGRTDLVSLGIVNIFHKLFPQYVVLVTHQS